MRAPEMTSGGPAGVRSLDVNDFLCTVYNSEIGCFSAESFFFFFLLLLEYLIGEGNSSAVTGTWACFISYLCSISRAASPEQLPNSVFSTSNPLSNLRSNPSGSRTHLCTYIRWLLYGGTTGS
ncbi:hypothetical protein EYC84_011362 [Monilinia fructicola]|uniref:Uncharacterized protein n=1 Tax=Monilinia fructicola TaxID=38448 RepID=A0A5M9J536_MONFR|nr:hypothetical protein EYC84_011362 [Monilinia fructicola]